MAMASAKSTATPWKVSGLASAIFCAFRGVHKEYLAQYVAIFEWAHNLKKVTRDYLRLLIFGLAHAEGRESHVEVRSGK